MFPTEVDWMQRARQLYQETRDLGQALAEIHIAKALMDIYVEGAQEIETAVKLAAIPAVGAKQ